MSWRKGGSDARPNVGAHCTSSMLPRVVPLPQSVASFQSCSAVDDELFPSSCRRLRRIVRPAPYGGGGAGGGDGGGGRHPSRVPSNVLFASKHLGGGGEGGGGGGGGGIEDAQYVVAR